jgi:hypothetical protein
MQRYPMSKVNFSQTTIGLTIFIKPIKYLADLN